MSTFSACCCEATYREARIVYSITLLARRTPVETRVELPRAGHYVPVAAVILNILHVLRLQEEEEGAKKTKKSKRSRFIDDIAAEDGGDEDEEDEDVRSAPG